MTNANENTSRLEPLDVLKKVYEQLRPKASWQLVAEFYEIEREFQYAEDHGPAIERLKRLVSSHAELELAKDRIE